jgi:hypothetical protein
MPHTQSIAFQIGRQMTMVNSLEYWINSLSISETMRNRLKDEIKGIRETQSLISDLSLEAELKIARMEG